ncbi:MULTISPECIES: AbiJ-NTD4 domain-containing protein [unclassified Microbulbifer]|uniref:AbiJ-NTD4 domain-containing protein n=1 Tax=unclassified Microbulbifer TaxID=2619833 RepID=UPI0027E59296|nr:MULTISPECIES: hypothetical protein [unclassified Microbulbifer]
MLTDIFVDRYIGVPMWDSFGEVEKRFIVQGFRMISEHLYPYWVDGKESSTAKARWTAIHDKLSMELGLSELSPKYYSFQSMWNGKPHTQSGSWSMDKVCKDFVCAEYDGNSTPDRFMKERISFIELAFREREEQIKEINTNLPKQLLDAKLREQRKRPGVIRISGSMEETIQAMNDKINDDFRASVEELNERLRRANYKLNYHNSFIQISEDELIESQIEKGFWNITKDPLWKNVDIDMKEAIDLRDSGGRDPAFYAARALESAIKIISDKKGWTHSGEKGAHSFIDNLGSKKNGSFINAWERDCLKIFFTEVRNPFGHGAGSEEMPKLYPQQTDWAIETCMSWIKSLVKRL